MRSIKLASHGEDTIPILSPEVPFLDKLSLALFQITSYRLFSTANQLYQQQTTTATDIIDVKQHSCQN
jgi:hypothetical protein